ncbi:MAG: ATP-binding protein [Cytophagales bacterium CG12_big_fil_rev_8_21_14_0_65_40_12]|nr:MAG: ATP-binding protein [Cytophagales bacterium CG12_big_fil_rev_8_21_14_0_65_40_12]PIW05472.1 MAG: ATP-binding protein [Cytophagales bacterium CG17_big_fil_post_rev_8_21_14_2_50_40_13]
MVSKRFALLVILRVTLLMLSMTALAFIFAKTELFFNQIILLSIIVIQIAELIRFITFTNRELAKLLLAIRYSDFSISFKGKKHGKSFQELQNAFVEIIEAFKKVSVEKEAQFKFLKVIVDNINVGIIAIKEEHQIELMNKSAQQLLSIPAPNYWKQFVQFSPDFAREFSEMEDNERKLIELNIKEEKLQISAHVTRLKILNYRYSIITFQNIKSEIEQKEIEAWHKLIRILTHEIMNSVTPITSLTETMRMMLQQDETKEKKAQELSEEDLDDFRFSLETIQRRSEGLLHFVEDYRKLTRVKNLDQEQVEATELLENMAQLMTPELQKEQITLELRLKNSFKLFIDRKLIEQVLINLITNAKHALKTTEKPLITISAYSRESEKVIEITDNGTGIDESKIDQIFIPFFSTKENGSGIGLSLSKQIMKKHRGDLTVKSEKDKGASFRMSFKG